MEFSYSLPHVPSYQLLYLKEIDLNNYYTNHGRSLFIHCKICRFDILRDSLFKHTVSKQHKYNKLLVCIVQNCSSNADIDFVIVNINKLQCRYCDSLIIDINQDDSVINGHIRDIIHIRKKLAFLSENCDRQSSENSIIECNSLKPLDSLITHDKKYKRRTNKSTEIIQKKMSSKNSMPQFTKLISEQRQSQDAIDEIIQINSMWKWFVQELELLMKDLEKTIEFHQNNVQPCPGTFRDKEIESGEELLDCISIKENGLPRCTVCLLTVPNNIHNINEHVNGKKHKQNMRKSVESTSQISILKDIVNEITKYIKVCRSAVKKSKQANLPTMTNSVPITAQQYASCSNKEMIAEEIDDKRHTQQMIESMKLELHNFTTEIGEHLGRWQCVIEKSNRTAKELRDVNNIDQNNIPQSSASCEDKGIKREKKISDCMSFGKNGALICTICLTEVPNTVYNIDLHINGKKHKQKILKSLDSKVQVLGLKNTKISMPAPPSTPNSDSNMYTSENTVTKDVGSVSVLPYHGDDLVNFIAINGTWACKTCRMAFSDINLLDDHASSSNHKKNIRKGIQRLHGYSNAENLWVCNVCSKLLHKRVKNQHMISKKHQLDVLTKEK